MVTINEQTLFTPRQLRVVAVGAGFSGLLLAYKHKYENASDYMDLTIYEKNSDIGGTWFENRYPGLKCDLPAHSYTFSFEPNPDWTGFYASGPEILDYAKRTTTKYGLDEHIQFNSKIVESTWDDDLGVWNIKIQKGAETVTDRADVLINTGGWLNKRQWPDIEGLHAFQGQLVHTAAWKDSIDWKDKRVAIIGNGSSAIQVLPEMQKTAKHLTTYIRTPTWVIANFLSQEFAKDGGNFKYTEAERKEFRDSPEKLKQYRHDMEHALNGYFAAFIKDSPGQNYLRDTFTQVMQDRLKDSPHLSEKLMPDFPVGCRRPTPGDGYLEALQAANVSVEFGGIEKITPKGIVNKSGQEEEFDIIVCATGFDVSYSPAWDMIGVNGVSLAERWRDHPEAYLSICAPSMPNYFMFYSANSPVVQGSFFTSLDATAKYVLRWCERIATSNIKSVVVSEAATQEYNEYTQEVMKRCVFSGGCRSWYKNRTINGRVIAVYAGSLLHYKSMLEAFRTEDFEFQYLSKNLFRFMGNGFTARDVGGKDLAPYVMDYPYERAQN